MAFTRTYPIAVQKYYGNPLIKWRECTVTNGSDTITNVITEIQSAASIGWYCVLQVTNLDPLAESSNTGTFRIADPSTPGQLQLTNMDGTPYAPVVAAPGTATYSIYVFSNLLPSNLDGPCEAILFDTVTAAGVFSGITNGGQYFELNTDGLVAGAIYNIGIREIIDRASCTGVLLGTSGIMGSGIIG
jgi:hypothetical protein